MSWASARSSREIITIEVGQCGNQLGFAFWEKACKEHKLAASGKFEGDPETEGELIDKVGVFFNETGKHRHVPRTVFVDTEPGVHEKIQSREYGKIFSAKSFVHSFNGAGNCWASGFFSEGQEIIDNVLDAIRQVAEQCDSVQALQVIHSIGGGTGSGLGSLVLEKVAARYMHCLRVDYTVYPSKKASDTVVEPYNAMCAMPFMIENSDMNFVMDNEAIYHISNDILKAGTSFLELNHIISSAMCGITASLRFPGWLNCDLRKLSTNLVPFPRLHFMLQSEAPLQASSSLKYGSGTKLRDIVAQMVDKTHFFTQLNVDRGLYMSCAAMFRGRIPSSKFEKATMHLQDEMDDDFVAWIPDHFKTSSVNVPSPQYPVSATFVANTTAMRQLFDRLNKQYMPLYKRKAFLAPYKEHGMDEMMFQEAQANVLDLMQEYSDRQDATVPEFGMMGEELGLDDDYKDEDYEDEDPLLEEDGGAADAPDAAGADEAPAVSFDESSDDEI